MAQSVDQFAGPARKRSGWLIPIAVFVVTAALSAMFLVYYFGPSAPELLTEQPAPTDSSDIVSISVGDVGFHIPANYMLFASARRGGENESLALIALLPALQGYTLAEAQEFASNAPDSRVVHIVLRRERVALSDGEKFQRIYRPVVASEEGAATEFGARLYTFRDDSGYRSEELYVTEGLNGTSLLRCTRPATELPSPSCLGDIPLGNGLVATYRFKRGHVEDWPEILATARALIGSFMDRS